MTPILTDRNALDLHRARASVHLWHHEALAEMQDRLTEVNRTFTMPVVVTPFPAVWQNFQTVPDTDLLALAENSHDLIIHAMSLHWANDPVGQLVQCRRALRPDGLFLAVLFGGQTLNELRSALAQAESEIPAGLSPRVLPMAEIRDLGALLQRAGFALPVADSYTKTVLYRDALHLMQDLRAMGEGNALANRLRHPTARAIFQRAAQLYCETHATKDGLIPATFEIITLTGWAQHESQQKPLRPGSAVNRLAEALNGLERQLPPEH